MDCNKEKLAVFFSLNSDRMMFKGFVVSQPFTTMTVLHVTHCLIRVPYS